MQINLPLAVVVEKIAAEEKVTPSQSRRQLASQVDYGQVVLLRGDHVAASATGVAAINPGRS